MAAIVACNSLPEQLPGSENAVLSIKVEAQTKALITESVLPDASEIGVFFSEPDKTSYDESTYENIKFTAAGANAAQIWTPETEILLSGTKGTLYGYYPYSTEVSDITSIPVDVTTQNDYMWATPVEKLSNEASTAVLHMQHALTAVRFNIKNKDYSGAGVIKAVSMKSASLASNATLDATDGALSNVTGANTAIVSDFEPFMISTDGTKEDIIAVPVLGNVSAVDIELTIDDQVFVTTVADQKFTSGQITEYILMVGNTDFKVDGVEITPWVIESTTEIEMTQTKEGLLAATYNVTDVSSAISLYNLPEVETKASGSELISKMFVDGIEVTPSAEYKFETTGPHVVEFEFIDSDVIPSNFFKRNNNLISMSIPSTYKEISDSTFKLCKELVSANIPSSVITIGASAFEGCDKLNTFKIPSTIETLGEKAFSSCSGITQIVIPTNRTCIDSYEFSNCLNLQSIVIPEGVTAIRYAAFEGCSNLKEVKLPSTLKWIDQVAFRWCRNIKEITLPDGLEIIGKEAFASTGLTSIEIPKSVYEIRLYAFDGFQIESIVVGRNVDISGIPHGLTQNEAIPFHPNVILDLSDELDVNCITKEYINSIPDYWMYGSFILPETVTSIEDEAFVGCSNLQSIRIPDSVTKIGKKAFFNCGNLTKANIPTNLNELHDYAFSRCGKITDELQIPETITVLDTGVFANTELTKVILSSQTIKILYEAFKECGTIDMTLPETVIIIEDDAIYKTNFNNKNNLPDNIEKIGKRAFYKHDAQEVTLPTNLRELGANAFYGSSNLLRITIPDEVTIIPSGAFSGCTSLVEVNMPIRLVKIGYGAFYNCQKLENIEFPDRYNTFKEIEGEAFRKCYSLKEINIPNSVTHIGMQAFSECTSAETLYLPQNLEWMGGLCFCGDTALYQVTLPVETDDIAWYDNSVVRGFFDGCEIRYVSNYSTISVSSISGRTIEIIGEANLDEKGATILTNYGTCVWPTDFE